MHNGTIVSMIKILESMRNHKRAVLLASVGLAVCVFVLLSNYIKPRQPVNPPVVGVNKMEVLGVGPEGDVETIDPTFSVLVKFNENLDGKTDGMLITISPDISFEMFVTSSQPNVLRIVPLVKETDAVIGWVDGTTYTITVKKDSKTSSGAVLNEDYSFSFTRRTENINLDIN